MKILLDMNIPLKYSSLLAEKDVEVTRWSDVGVPNAMDTEIMAYARDNDFIVLTCDLDFGTILSVTHDLKPSVTQVRASLVHAEKAVELITIALVQYAAELEQGAILSVDIKSARLRLLPL